MNGRGRVSPPSGERVDQVIRDRDPCVDEGLPPAPLEVTDPVVVADVVDPSFRRERIALRGPAAVAAGVPPLADAVADLGRLAHQEPAAALEVAHGIARDALLADPGDDVVLVRLVEGGKLLGRVDQSTERRGSHRGLLLATELVQERGRDLQAGHVEQHARFRSGSGRRRGSRRRGLFGLGVTLADLVREG